MNSAVPFVLESFLGPYECSQIIALIRVQRAENKSSNCHPNYEEQRNDNNEQRDTRRGWFT